MTALARKFIQERETDPAAIGRRALAAQSQATQKAVAAKAATLARQRPYKTIVGWKQKRADLGKSRRRRGSGSTIADSAMMT